MTAPAEDPRGGECSTCRHGEGQHTRLLPINRPGRCGVWDCLCSSFRPPAAGRGDTDSGGEAWTAYVATCQRCASAARPAGDRAQPTEELREAIAEALWLAQPEFFVSPWLEISETTRERYRAKADALLAGPLAALLDAQAKVEGVEALCEDGGHEGWVSTRALRRALDGAR